MIFEGVGFAQRNLVATEGIILVMELMILADYNPDVVRWPIPLTPGTHGIPLISVLGEVFMAANDFYHTSAAATRNQFQPVTSHRAPGTLPTSQRPIPL